MSEYAWIAKSFILEATVLSFTANPNAALFLAPITNGSVIAFVIPIIFPSRSYMVAITVTLFAECVPIFLISPLI